MQKRAIILGAVLILITGAAAADTGAVLLKLPLRAVSEAGPVTDLKSQDLSLSVNGARREIRDLIARTKAFGAPAGPRDFILSFNFTEYGAQVGDGVRHFVSRCLRPEDRIILISPLKLYPIDNQADAAKTAAEIEDILRRDSLNHKKNRMAARENLLTEIRRISRTGSITSGQGRSGMTTDMTQNEIMQFLSNYSREWNDFKTKFLYPDLRALSSAISHVATRGSEAWLICFQQREVMPALGEFKKVAREIRDYLSSVTTADAQATAASIASALQTMEKSLRVSESYPDAVLRNLLLGGNVTYNLILFSSLRKDIGSPDDVSPDLEGILRQIAEATGGTHLDTTYLAAGLDRIAAHTDRYYDLIFAFDGSVEDKKIEVTTVRPGTDLDYKDLFYKGEISRLVDYLKQPSVRVHDFSSTGHTIKFSISDYKMEERDGEDAAFIRVKIELVNDGNEVVHSASRTLKSTRDSLTISLGLPDRHSGYFQLRIGAEDLLTQKSHEISQYVKL